MKGIPRPRIVLLSLMCIGISWVSWVGHFTNIWYGNAFTWLAWLASIVLLVWSVWPTVNLFLVRKLCRRESIALLLFVVVLYLLTHLVNFSGAPWNSNGLFDDAAWDIYFANTHIGASPYQAAFFDEVGYISRETVFHYYITAFFLLFGSNLLVFNIALLVLGFITILATVFVVHSLFGRWIVTIISAVIMNVFPLHFLQIFMGHRYAITAPLMMVSLYFLVTAWQRQSLVRSVISSLFAAFCAGSSVMGKQYLYGLIAGTAVLALYPAGRSTLVRHKRLIGVWIAGFVLCATPLLAYIAFHPFHYSIREASLIREFTQNIAIKGFAGIQEYVHALSEVFFAPQSYRRQFSSEFPAIPFAYYALIIPGFVALWKRRRFEVVLLAVIPVVSAFVSGAYDFRVLLAVPFWIIATAAAIDMVFLRASGPAKGKRWVYPVMMGSVVVVIMSGMVPSVRYLWNIAHNPHSQHLLPHRDVAVSRLLQDIIAGENSPTSRMKQNEFACAPVPVMFDVFACPTSAYAIAHLFLQPFDDASILKLCDGGNQLLMTGEYTQKVHKDTIVGYVPRGKDLKLIWEVSDRSQDIINLYRQFSLYGHEEFFSDTVDGQKFSLYVLTIDDENIRSFQQEVAKRL